ncbi:MAG: substrate-binding domain-containing protein [Candidatus Bathyarchaeota archaeon]|nr:substrate-binding domain-containing protein [Candidatus Bathyarchaeota archaeon]
MQAWLKLLIIALLATIIVVAGTLVYFNYFSKRRLFISTTTSLDDTGVLAAVEADYEATHNVDLMITAVGTGIAIQQAKNGDADVVLVHAPSVELEFLEGGYGVNRKIISYNFFTIVGPADDPAQISGKTANEALFNIVQHGRNMPDHSGGTQIWVSRGDNSGTNSKEKSLWTATGNNYTELSEEIWFASTGQGMGSTLTITDQKGAYALSDIGTYLKFYTDGSIELNAFILEEQSLLNVYSVMAVNPTIPANQSVHEQINFNDAMDFIEYLISPATQQLINDFSKETYGQPLFYKAVQPLKDNTPQPLVGWLKDLAFFDGSECPPQYRNGYENLYT